MRKLFVIFLFCSSLQAVKFVKDVLPAAGALTTLVVNGDAIIKAIKHPKATVKKAIKKVVKK
jgi:hypothetical protein